MNKFSEKWDTYHTKGVRKKYLFRYGQDWKVKSFLESKSLYMTKMSNFDDKLEGISTYDITELQNAYEVCFIENENDIDPSLLKEWKQLKERSRNNLVYIAERMSKTQNAHFVSCWFNSDRESDGMWRFYAGEDGFAIKIDRKDFQGKIKKSVSKNIKSSNQSIIAGRIKYQDFPRVIEREAESKVKYLAFRKDESFAHEKEYRIVLVDKSNEAQSKNNEMYRILDFDELHITIIAHPICLMKSLKNIKLYLSRMVIISM